MPHWTSEIPDSDLSSSSLRLNDQNPSIKIRIIGGRSDIFWLNTQTKHKVPYQEGAGPGQGYSCILSFPVHDAESDSNKTLSKSKYFWDVLKEAHEGSDYDGYWHCEQYRDSKNLGKVAYRFSKIDIPVPEPGKAGGAAAPTDHVKLILDTMAEEHAKGRPEVRDTVVRMCKELGVPGSPGGLRDLSESDVQSIWAAITGPGKDQPPDDDQLPF